MTRGGHAPTHMTETAPSTEPLNTNRVWTPLRENHFEPPPLSARERAYLVHKACEAAQELVERARSVGGPITWRHVEKNNNVQLYVGSPCSSTSGTPPAAASMCGVTSVPGTVKEVASLFELASTRHMKEFARAHREWFYDGVVLHTLAPRAKEAPLHQVTAKWMVVQMPHGIAHRDFCYLECQDRFIDAKGRKGWVLGQHSIKLPGCDDLKREFGFVRGSLYHSGFVVVESEEQAGYVDVIHLVQLNLKDRTPMSMGLLRARVLFVAQVRNMLRSKRLNEQRYLSDLELVPRKYRNRCVVCKASFSLLLLRKMNCRKCGEVVCAACSKEFPIENRNFAATNGGDEVRKLRICMRCFQVITNAPKPTSALVQPAHSSTMSFLGYCEDDQNASFQTSRVGQRGEEAPKIFLQSMRREKPLRPSMSCTLPFAGLNADARPSTSRYRMREKPDADMYPRSQHYQQQHDYECYHRDSQRMRPSDFRPSQSLSLDDPIARGKGSCTLRLPGALPPASIFDRSISSGSRRPHHGMPRSGSSDRLEGTDSRNMSNFSRLQELSSRERLKQLQLSENYMTQSNIDYRIPDAYMSALHQASRDKHEFDVPPPVYQAPSSDFGMCGAALDDQPVVSTEFGPCDSILNEMRGPPPLDMSALSTSESSIPIELNTVLKSPTRSRDGGKEHEFLRLHEIDQRRDSASSDSSASSIDIDTYDDPPMQSVVAAIPEQQKYHGEQCQEPLMSNSVPRSIATVKNLAGSRENGKKEANVYDADADDDSETSMGASDDEEESCASAKLAPSSPASRLNKSIDDSAEETKAHEFGESPALPPPSPSAHTATRKMLERPFIANSSTGLPSGESAEKKRNDAGEYSTYGRNEPLDKEGPAGHEQRLSEIGDSLVLNTNGSDASYLDADIRQFHEHSPSAHQSSSGGAPNSHEGRDVNLPVRRH